MDAANAATEHVKADRIAVTWAMTDSTPAKRLRIGKIWKPAGEGKWPVTPGAKRKSYVFEPTNYPDLEAFAADLTARLHAGCFAPVAGRLKLLSSTVIRDAAYPRNAKYIADLKSWLLALDFDGLALMKAGARLDRPEDIGDAVLAEVRKRLPPAFKAADCLLVATSSTGTPFNSKGEPANGRARFRAIFLLSRPLFFAEQKQIVSALGKRPGLDCLDLSIYSVSQFAFVARPIFSDGMADPIHEPVILRKGGQRQVDVDMLVTEVDVELASPKGRSGTRGTPVRAEVRRLDVAPELRVPLVSQAVEAIVNDLNRVDWVHFAHAVDGSVEGDPAGRDIFLKFTARWEGEADLYEEDFDQAGEVDPPEGWEEPDQEEEAERMWDTRGEGRAGYGYLMQLLRKQETDEAEAAIDVIQLERAREAFKDPPPEEPDDEDDDDDDVLLARRAPTISPRAFYGPLDRIVTETTKESEATKVGVAAQIMAHVSLTLRPFYNPLGDTKIPFNIYAVQVGPSGRGRKGTSAAIADAFLGPAILRLAAQVQARIAFPDEDEDARNAAEVEVAETARRLSWTRNVSEDLEGEIEARLATLRDDDSAAAREIAQRKASLKAKARSPRTVRDQEKLIAAAQARRDDIAAQIAVDEAELAAVRRALNDQEAALRQAQAAYDTAQAKFDGLPPPASPAPWLDLFASLAEGPVSARGVSTGEGLIELIRDPGKKPGFRGPVDDPGVANKCLFLNLDELGSVLAVIMRPGATLSSTLRTTRDCSVTELVNKNSPTRCKEPYVTISASITPGELMGRLFDKRDTASSADNGLANRFLYLWVQRDKLKARPLATPGLDAMMDTIAGNIFSVYETLKPDGAFLSTPIDFSPAAYARYELEYPRIANLKAAGRRAAKLIERLLPYLRRIAAILAVMNGESEISEGALEAAIAWVDYAAGTVNAIATTASERKNTRILAGDGETILAALKALGGDGKPVSRRDVQRKTRLEKKRFEAAIVELMQQGPAPIVVSESAYTIGRGARRTQTLLALNRLAAVEDEI
jgi:hypothetical protein